MKEKDRLYSHAISDPGDFVFDQRVVRVFPDMINRSVPGYGTIVPMMGMLARRYALPGTRVYDLGCSLGAVSLAIRSAVGQRELKIIAVDNSPDMIRGFRDILEGMDETGLAPVELRQQDICDMPLENASVVVLNFTLQFVPPGQRDSLLRRIAEALHPGGVLLLSEKVRFDDPEEQSLQTHWHHDFKRAKGYSELEIARKRDALENVMKPESMAQHRARLEEAGFDRAYTWFQGFNFMSMLAFR